MEFRIEHFRTPPARCPKCRKFLDATTGVRGRSPKPGDVSLCIECGADLMFDAHGRPVQADPVVWTIAMQDPVNARLVGTMRQLIAERKRKRN